MLEVKRDEIVTMRMDGEYANKLSSAINNAMKGFASLSEHGAAYQMLVNSGTIDTLLALKMVVDK